MRKLAPYLFPVIVVSLTVLGLIVLSSAGCAAAQRFGRMDPYHFIYRQLIYLGGALVVGLIVAALDYHLWQRIPFLTILSYLVVMGLLVAVFFFPRINGSWRWINLGFFNLQPSELSKIFLIIALSVYLDRLGWRIDTIKYGFIGPCVVLGGFAGLILFETDFGSVMVLGILTIALMVLFGVKWRYTGTILGMGATLFLVKLINDGNRMNRIAAFLGVSLSGEDAALNPAAYQSNMALVALQRGGLTGVGYMQSMQKYGYLPEAHTDFIFAVGTEEFGLIFSLGVILLFLLFFIFALVIARNASDRFGSNLAYGMALLIFFEAMFNIAVVSGAAPSKGMALPFFSYGGTNIVVTYFAVGMILSVAFHRAKEFAHRHKQRLSRVIMRG